MMDPQATENLMLMPKKSWELGLAAQAFLESGELVACLQACEQAVQRQGKDGRLGLSEADEGSTDPAAGGEALFRMSERYRRPPLREAAHRMRQYLLVRAPKSPEGWLYHVLKRPELWIDSLYMAPPFLASCGDYDAALLQIDGLHECLWNQESQLYSHIYDAKAKALIRGDFWGSGNGWAAAGLTRVIGMLPSDRNADRKRLIFYLKELFEGCLRHLRPDGLFHDVIDKPATFVETNLSQMLAYSIFAGVKGQWLEEDMLGAAQKMRAGALAKVDGKGWVQGVCGAPDFKSPGTSAEGQAFHLLMETAALEFESAE